MGYFSDRALFGKEAADAMLGLRFIISFILMVLFSILAFGFVCYLIYQELSLELSYQHQYGSKWKIEFERYHGSISHAHTNMIVAGSCLVALVLVVVWFCRHLLHKHKHQKHRHATPHSTTR